MLHIINQSRKVWFMQSYELTEKEITDLIDRKLRGIIYKAGNNAVKEVKGYCLDNGIKYTALLHDHVLIIMNEYLSQLG